VAIDDIRDTVKAFNDAYKDKISKNSTRANIDATLGDLYEIMLGLEKNAEKYNTESSAIATDVGRLSPPNNAKASSNRDQIAKIFADIQKIITDANSKKLNALARIDRQDKLAAQKKASNSTKMLERLDDNIGELTKIKKALDDTTLNIDVIGEFIRIAERKSKETSTTLSDIMSRFNDSTDQNIREVAQGKMNEYTAILEGIRAVAAAKQERNAANAKAAQNAATAQANAQAARNAEAAKRVENAKKAANAQAAQKKASNSTQMLKRLDDKITEMTGLKKELDNTTLNIDEIVELIKIAYKNSDDTSEIFKDIMTRFNVNTDTNIREVAQGKMNEYTAILEEFREAAATKQGEYADLLWDSLDAARNAAKAARNAEANPSAEATEAAAEAKAAAEAAAQRFENAIKAARNAKAAAKNAKAAANAQAARNAEAAAKAKAEAAAAAKRVENAKAEAAAKAKAEAEAAAKAEAEAAAARRFENAKQAAANATAAMKRPLATTRNTTKRTTIKDLTDYVSQRRNALSGLISRGGSSSGDIKLAKIELDNATKALEKAKAKAKANATHQTGGRRTRKQRKSV